MFLVLKNSKIGLRNPKIYLPLMAMFILILSSFDSYRSKSMTVGKKIKYTERAILTHALSNLVDKSKLHEFDMLDSRMSDEISNMEISIESDGQIEFTRTYLRNETYDGYDFKKPWKVVCNSTGTYLYDKQGIQYYHNPTSSESPFPIFTGDLSQIGKFIYEPQILKLDINTISNAASSGANVIVNLDNSYKIVDGNYTTIVNPNENTIETLTYVEGKLSKSYFVKLAAVGNGNYVKAYSIEKTYSKLLNGGDVEQRIRRIYSNYSIDGASINISEINPSSRSKRSNKLEFDATFNASDLTLINQIQINPIPSNDFICVSFIKQATDHSTSNYTILTANGIPIISGPILPYSKLDISKLKPGVYILKVDNTKEILFSKFIKS